MNAPHRLRFAATLLLLAALWPALAAAEFSFPPPISRYAAISREGPQRPWNLTPDVSSTLFVASYPDPVAPPPPYPIPAEPKKGEGEDPAFWNLRSGLLALAENKLDAALFEFSEGARKGGETGSADACLFWLGETRVRKGKLSEAAIAYGKVKGALEPEAKYRAARIGQNEGRLSAARKAWGEITADGKSPYVAEALYRLGVFEASEGALGEAQVNFANALAKTEPSSDVAAGAAFEAARLNRDAGNPAEAERLLLSLLLARPEHPLADGARVLLGWALGDLGNFAAAGARIEPMLKRPGLPEGFAVRARYQLARSAAALGDHSGARTLAAELLLVSDGPWAGWSSADYAYALYRSGRFDEALGAYLEAEKLWRGEGAGELAFAVGECQFRLGRHGEAASSFARLDPSSEAAPYAWHRGAEALVGAGDRLGALRNLERIMAERSEYPQMAEVRALAGTLYFEEGRNREALAALENVGESGLGWELLSYLRGWQAFEGGDYPGAIPALEKHLALGSAAPKRYQAAAMLGRAEYELGRIDLAVAALRVASAEAESPELAEKARYDVGWMLINSGRDAEGTAELEKLVADYPNGATSARARYALGQSRALSGRHEEALARFGEVEKVATSEPELAKLAVKGKIEALTALANHEGALAECRKLGDDPEGMGCAVYALFRLGRVDEALGELDKFATRHPGDSAVAELEARAADALLAAGRKGEAIDRLGRLGARLGDARGGEALVQRAALLEGEGRGEEALAQYSALASGAGDLPLRVHSSRKAASLEVSLGKTGEAAKRLEEALKLPGLADEFAHQLLNDLAETLLKAGDFPTALEKARRASTMGAREESLRTDILIADALEKSGNPNAALETLLRIGYHYDLSKPAAAEAARRAATLLEGAGRLEEAGELRAKLASAAAEAGGTDPEPPKGE